MLYTCARACVACNHKATCVFDVVNVFRFLFAFCASGRPPTRCALHLEKQPLYGWRAALRSEYRTHMDTASTTPNLCYYTSWPSYSERTRHGGGVAIAPHAPDNYYDSAITTNSNMVLTLIGLLRVRLLLPLLLSHMFSMFMFSSTLYSV